MNRLKNINELIFFHFRLTITRIEWKSCEMIREIAFCRRNIPIFRFVSITITNSQLYSKFIHPINYRRVKGCGPETIQLESYHSQFFTSSTCLSLSYYTHTLSHKHTSFTQTHSHTHRHVTLEGKSKISFEITFCALLHLSNAQPFLYTRRWLCH